jgi:hypothetical protein
MCCGENKIYCSEGSQKMPARPSGKGSVGGKVERWEAKMAKWWEVDCLGMQHREEAEHLCLILNSASGGLP